MDLAEAIEKASRVLEEEQVRPTLTYVYVATDWPVEMRFEESQMRQQGYQPSSSGLMLLINRLRKQSRPRTVLEDPTRYRFLSTNYDLLLTIFNQVGIAERAPFVSSLLNKFIPARTFRMNGPQPVYPSWSSHTSSLPLLAEFCVRVGHTSLLLKATEILEYPTQSMVIMLIQMEEMIALNFNLFSDAELAEMAAALAHLREIADRQTWASKGPRGGQAQKNLHYRQGFDAQGSEIVRAIDGIASECQQARYWYLKGALEQTPNLEIDDDKLRVQNFLQQLGFSDTMIEALDAAEQDYRAEATPFELKNCLSHLRSFLEHLHRETAKYLAAKAGDTIVDRWGNATTYLRQHGIFSQQHEKFSASLYTLISDESVHPLGADREYARLLRNVVIEYGVMFLTALNKQGIKLI
jgi:hypothetical protein